ncbi:MAG: ATP-binding protein [Proteobacteria bacterium]|nr:ATP-binding protein [Pseudomonadota bacterium]
MVYRNFRLICGFRISLLAITIFVFIYLLLYTEFYVTSTLFGILIGYQIYSLFRFVETTNRHLTSFLESIRYADFSRSFQAEGLGASFDALKSAFNNVIGDFQEVRREKEEHYQYLQNVVQHIGIALIAFRKNGEVELINKAAKKLFQLNNLKNIKSLDPINPELVTRLSTLKSGEKALVKANIDDDYLQLVIYATEFKLRNQFITLVSIQDIQAELEEQEMEAWQNLIRVLTHEIMNSITPIASLTDTVKTMIGEASLHTEDKAPRKSDDGAMTDIRDALNTIHKRSIGLIRFVETYRSLTQVPKPDFGIVPVKNLFQNIQRLMERELQQKNVIPTFTVEPDSLELTADEELIEQVLINILKNALHALEKKENGKIELKAFMGDRGRIIVQILDNGPGILEDVIDKIFIPFFTTKPDGSGIGLSLSRQIMRVHGGSITAHSIPDRETGFTLKF